MQLFDAITALAPVVAEFQRLGVRHYIGGSLASSIYGLARSTRDVDLVADLQHKHVAPFVAALASRYYVSEPMILDAIDRKSCFNLIHLVNSFKIDVFVTKGRPYDRAAFERIRSDTIDPDETSQTFQFASPEDTVIAKLEWYRLGDEASDRQWRDIVEVMLTQEETLDRPYLARWATELGVADLLDKAWKEVEA